MPEYSLAHVADLNGSETTHNQYKLCPDCHAIIDPTSYGVFVPAGLCQSCRDASTSPRSTLISIETRTAFIDGDNSPALPLIGTGVNIAHGMRRPLLDDMESTNAAPQAVGSYYSARVSAPPKRHVQPSYTPSPFTDITRIRVRSTSHHCLYPGASFQGTQKSGRNSYDVNVTIVDVDFSSSFLCGYLRIRGLTDDWPELTTYFDAEIIGSRYGFLTQNWGANEQEDMVHWSRFPAFRHVKHDLKKPLMTMPDRDRGAVFMRWKERFLVPDHRVQDINGASFAGFYYVCVDFNPPAARSPSRAVPLSREEEDSPTITPQSLKINTSAPPQRARDPSTHRGGRSTSRSTPSPVATMSGFYFHQNSEPYQQLSLHHLPERTSSSFEFR